MQRYATLHPNLAMQAPVQVNLGYVPTTNNPYHLQSHAQQAVPSAHNNPPVTGPGHAPPLSNLPANPSAIHPKNIVRNFLQG